MIQGITVAVISFALPAGEGGGCGGGGHQSRDPVSFPNRAVSFLEPGLLDLGPHFPPPPRPHFSPSISMSSDLIVPVSLFPDVGGSFI